MAKPSIYDQDTNDAIRNRIMSLSENNQQKWGKMNLPQILAHLRKAMEIGLDQNKKSTFNFIGFVFGARIKKMVLSDEPYKEGLPTAKSMIIKNERNFNEEKEKLLTTFDQFKQNGPMYAAAIKHPLFGYLTGEEWGYAQWKHFDHHLRQFNA